MWILRSSLCLVRWQADMLGGSLVETPLGSFGFLLQDSILSNFCLGNPVTLGSWNSFLPFWLQRALSLFLHCMVYPPLVLWGMDCQRTELMQTIGRWGMIDWFLRAGCVPGNWLVCVGLCWCTDWDASLSWNLWNVKVPLFIFPRDYWDHKNQS